MRWAVGVVCAFVTCATLALGTEPENVALEFTAPESCPDQARFKGEVQARTELVRFSGDTSARRFRVLIEARESGFAGRLEIVDAAGERTLRDIDGAVCGDVVSVLALDAALAIDPRASTAPASELATRPEAPAESAAPLPPAPAPPVASVTPMPTFVSSPPAVAARPSTPPRFAIGVGAHATSGPAPKILIGPAVFGELEWRRDELWSPLVRLGVRAARTGTIGPAFDDARFSWLIAKTELCPWRLALADEVAFRPCAFVDLGIDDARARAGVVTNAGGATRFWAAAGASAWLRFELQGGFLANLGGGVEAPLSRDDFVLERRSGIEPVHSVPLLGGHAEILAGYEFE